MTSYSKGRAFEYRVRRPSGENNANGNAKLALDCGLTTNKSSGLIVLR